MFWRASNLIVRSQSREGDHFDNFEGLKAWSSERMSSNFFFNHCLLLCLFQALVQGNIPWHEAIRISENIVNNMEGDAIPTSEMPKVHK